jgi:hypothetical protein
MKIMQKILFKSSMDPAMKERMCISSKKNAENNNGT